MKRSVLLIMIAACLCGCGIKDEGKKQQVQDGQVVMSMEELWEPVKISGKMNEEVMNESLPNDTITISTREKLPVNITQESTTMKWDGIRIQSRIFATVGNKMYFCQWEREGREACLYECEIGGNVFQKVDMEFAEGMDIYDMTTDEAGHLYLLLRNKHGDSGKVTSIIREVDENGEILEDHDISQALEDNISLHQAFLVDLQGNLYIRGMSSAVYISREGSALWEVKDSEIGIEHSFGQACGADGAIYLTYRKDNTTYLGKINSEDGTISEEYLLTAIKGQDQVLALGKGTDCDFLLYGNQSGCWAWNKTDNSMEARSTLSESELPYDESIIVRGFLQDGRLLLVKNVSAGDDLVGRKLEYYPAGK